MWVFCLVNAEFPLIRLGRGPPQAKVVEKSARNFLKNLDLIRTFHKAFRNAVLEVVSKGKCCRARHHPFWTHQVSHKCPDVRVVTQNIPRTKMIIIVQFELRSKIS